MFLKIHVPKNYLKNSKNNIKVIYFQVKAAPSSPVTMLNPTFFKGIIQGFGLHF